MILVPRYSIPANLHGFFVLHHKKKKNAFYYLTLKAMVMHVGKKGEFGKLAHWNKPMRVRITCTMLAANKNWKLIAKFALFSCSVGEKSFGPIFKVIKKFYWIWLSVFFVKLEWQDFAIFVCSISMPSKPMITLYFLGHNFWAFLRALLQPLQMAWAKASLQRAAD